MVTSWRRWACWSFALLVFAFQPVRAADGGRLVTPQWLQAALAAGDVLLLDASPAPQHAAGHIAGAVPVDAIALMGRDVPVEVAAALLRQWGVSPGQRIVVMDAGGSYFAPRVFFDLLYLGVPAAQLHLLDGGLAAWQAAGLPVTTARTPPPPPGTFSATVAREELRVRRDAFLLASGDPRRHALVDALEPAYFHGQRQFFDRPGHVPNAVSMPAEDFFNDDKTFKSPDEIRRMAAYRGVRPEMTVHAHCGGGGAAAVPFFALRFLAGFPDVKLYNESQREWLQDERELPLWTFTRPPLRREMAWVKGWNGGMLRAFGRATLNVIDLRPAAAYAEGHIPYALNLPPEFFAGALQQPATLAAALGAAGVDSRHEALLVTDGGLTPRAALAWWVLDQLGHARVTMLMESMDDWGLAGHALTKQPTVVGARRSPQDMAVPIARYEVQAPAGAAGAAAYPRVTLHAGDKAPPGAALAAGPGAAAGRSVHLPWRQLLTADGLPRPAGELLALLQKAGVPRYAEVVCVADDPGEAALVMLLLKQMGWTDVKLQRATAAV